MVLVVAIVLKLSRGACVADAAMKDNYSKAEENQTKADDDCAQYRAI
jgi:hypothetical protein